MLSDEEKKALKELTEIKELVEEDLKYKDYEVAATLDQIDLESLVIVLNLIEKQSKEIEELKETLKCTQNSWHEDTIKIEEMKKQIDLDMEKNQFTIGNDDNIDKAVEGLGQFCHNYCMNCKETEKTNDLVFRCGECIFLNEDNTCLIKKFIIKNCKGDYGKYTSMGSL